MGFNPARMVGHYLCSEKREPRTEAGGMLQISDQSLGVIHGRGLWSQFFLIIAMVFWVGKSFAAPPPPPIKGLQVAKAKSAGLAALEAKRDLPPTADELAAARGMEQMLADLLIQEMRKSIPENDLVPLSQGERVFRQMLDNEYARVISDAGMLGIADLVLAQMKGKR